MDGCSLFWSRQRGHGVDLAEQLVGGLIELSEVQSQRMRCVRVHVLKQKLAVPFYSVDRKSVV